MKRVLFGWELGANLGHAKPLACIAGALSNADTDLFVAARDLMNARIAFRGVNAQLLQAPVWPSHRHLGSQTSEANYLDVLAEIGFADPAKLAAVVGGWIALFDLVQPDALVVDHSPGLLLAAYLRGIPAVQVGSGFTVPPVEYERFPPIRADRAPVMSEGTLLSAVSAVAAEFGGAAPRSLIDIFRTRGRVVFGCPELDAYRPFRHDPLCLPPEPLPAFVEPPIEPRIFVYLGPEFPRIETLLQNLAELDVPLEIYLRGDIAPLGRFLALRGHQVYGEPPPLADVLPRVSHVICGAGAFTCHAALAAGRPVLALPLHGESGLNAAALEKLGVAKRLEPLIDAREIRAGIIGLLRDHDLLRKARLWAKVLAARPQPDGLVAAVDAVRHCIEGPRAASPNQDLRPVADAITP